MSPRMLAALLLVLVAACTSAPQYRDLPSETPAASVAASPDEVPAQFQSRYAAASTATTLFHVRFDQRNFSRIYAAADDSLRAATKEADFTSRLSVLRDRVGASQDENEMTVDIVERGQDLLVTLVLETTFDNAMLTETFVWRVTPAETALLVRYETR